MFIVIITGAFLPVPPIRGGAVEKIWHSMGLEFAAFGHRVVHISRAVPDFPDLEEVNGVQHIRVKGFETPSSLLKLKLLDLLYSLRTMSKIPKEADVIVTNTFWLPMLLRGKTGKKVFVDVARMPKGQMKFYINSLCLRGTSSAVAEAIKHELPAKYHPKVSMVPNPLPFTPAVDIDFLKKQPIILYTGRVHPEKGLEILINAYKNAAINYKLQIVGPWEAAAGGGGKEYLESLKALASGAVEFLEPVFDSEKLNNYYLDASIFVYPSVAEKGETFGLAPLEAMALGCVPIVSDLLCFKDFIRHGENGLVFDHRHKDAAMQLRDMLLLLTNDTAYREKLAKNALEVRKTHSPSTIAGLFISEFERLKDDNGYTNTFSGIAL